MASILLTEGDVRDIWADILGVDVDNPAVDVFMEIPKEGYSDKNKRRFVEKAMSLPYYARVKEIGYWLGLTYDQTYRIQKKIIEEAKDKHNARNNIRRV